MQVTARITGKPIAEQVHEYRTNLKIAGPQVVRRIARLVAVSCAEFSQPYGFDEGARKKGEHATAVDILRVYKTPSMVFNSFPDRAHGKAFWNAMQRRNYRGAENIVNSYHPSLRGVPIKPFDGGAAHRGARSTSTGKVGKKQKPVMIVTTTRSLFAYLDKEVGHVGQGKGGWAACAKAFPGGSRGIPQWVSRHAKNGSVYESYSGATWRVRMTSVVPYATQILRAGAQKAAVLNGINRYLLGQAHKLIKGAVPSE